MASRRERRFRAPKREQLAERFTTDGLDFKRALKRVLAGGPDSKHDRRRREQAVQPQPSTAEAQAWLDDVHADASDGSLWETPSIREQLRDAYKRCGLSD